MWAPQAQKLGEEEEEFQVSFVTVAHAEGLTDSHCCLPGRCAKAAESTDGFRAPPQTQHGRRTQGPAFGGLFWEMGTLGVISTTQYNEPKLEAPRDMGHPQTAAVSLGPFDKSVRAQGTDVSPNRPGDGPHLQGQRQKEKGACTTSPHSRAGKTWGPLPEVTRAEMQSRAGTPVPDPCPGIFVPSPGRLR